MGRWAQWSEIGCGVLPFGMPAVFDDSIYIVFEIPTTTPVLDLAQCNQVGPLRRRLSKLNRSSCNNPMMQRLPIRWVFGRSILCRTRVTFRRYRHSQGECIAAMTILGASGVPGR